jgi:segregation and condensation protein B
MEDPTSVVEQGPVDGATTSAPEPVGDAAPPKKAPGRRRKPASEAGGDASVEATKQNEPRREPRVAVPDELLTGAIEAVLMAADRAMPAAKLSAILGLTDQESGANKETLAKIEAAIAELNTAYESTGRSFRIEPLSGGYRVMSLAAFAPYLAELHRTRSVGRMTRAAVETLAIIAYKQPMTRAQLEAIRGVSCGEVLRSLTERRLITIKGRAEELGRPLLYGTTKQFLDAFGLSSVKDLPTMAEFKFAISTVGPSADEKPDGRSEEVAGDAPGPADAAGDVEGTESGTKEHTEGDA